MPLGLEPSQGRMDICLVFYEQPVLVPLFQCDGEGTAVICPPGNSAWSLHRGGSSFSTTEICILKDGSKQSYPGN